MLQARRNDQPLPVTVTTRWDWYRAGAIRHRRRYALMELTAICGAAAIPVAATAALSSVIVAGLGAVVLIATGIRTTFGLHENWVEHSQIRYAIEREVALYLVSLPPYDTGDTNAELVRVVEELTRNAGQQWATRRLRVTALTSERTSPRANS